MRFTGALICGIALIGHGLGAVANPAQTAEVQVTRLSRPNAILLEALGRGMLYSFSYDRAIAQRFSMMVGYGSVGAGSSAVASLIPVSGEFYFSTLPSSVYLIGGASVILNGAAVAGQLSAPGNLGFNSTPVAPHLGVGYENRNEEGFLFRAAVYGVLAANIVPWFGLSFGYSF